MPTMNLSSSAVGQFPTTLVTGGAPSATATSSIFFPVGTAASGVLTFTGISVDLDTLILNDAVNPPITFTVRTTPVGAFDVAIGVSATTQAAAFVTAINSIGPQLLMTAGNAAGVLTLTHDRPGTFANVAQTENITNCTFTPAWAGGLDPGALAGRAVALTGFQPFNVGIIAAGTVEIGPHSGTVDITLPATTAAAGANLPYIPLNGMTLSGSGLKVSTRVGGVLANGVQGTLFYEVK